MLMHKYLSPGGLTMDIMLVKTKMHPTLDTKRSFNIACMRVGVMLKLTRKNIQYFHATKWQ